MVKRLPTMQETQVRFLGQEDPLENRDEGGSLCGVGGGEALDDRSVRSGAPGPRPAAGPGPRP